MHKSTAKLSLLALVFIGCATFSKVQSNRNYVSIPGLVCTSPEMVDGDDRTGDTVYIGGSIGSGERTVTTPDSRYVQCIFDTPTMVNLPAEHKVGMIVLHGENLTNFKVLAKDGQKWKELRRFRNNRLKRVAVTTSTVTDAILIIAIDFDQIRGQPRPEIQEIEVYGIAQEEQ